MTNPVDSLISALAADSGVQAVLGNPARVYDHRPAMATFPYAVVSAGEARDIGTKTLAVTSHGVTLDVFSQKRAGSEVRQVLAAMRSALHDATLTLSAGHAVRCQQELVSVRFDPKSETSHGVARYRIVVSE